MFTALKDSSEDGCLKHLQYKIQCYAGIKKTSMHSKEGSTGIFLFCFVLHLLNQVPD